ncbi:histidine--tRNA ligase [Metallosphaera tengchongensis]|uniref:Histidine--tRNA ligase n=1 Tax=Metallosphaera tengchongensis TaxID=1532350 RepID=A0A6N0NUQ6_9CREN|nr:histidine--tRNA ligase [Metallosphaera tengchongensis]QKQ99876.1 histidine--tRNA ligase [Metallosphaera tengchongensis]
MIDYEPVRGMEDYFDEKADIIRYVEKVFRETVEKSGYSEAITPIVEDFELFSIKGGEELRKTMYVFKDKANRELALRPEITPSIVRLYLKSLQHFPKPVRLFYIGRVYRYDEPQLGRYREFRQAGVELLGSDSILADIEIIHILENFYNNLGLKDKISIKLNNIGVYRHIFNVISLNENDQEHVLHLMDKGNLDEAEAILRPRLEGQPKLKELFFLLTNRSSPPKLEELIEFTDKNNIAQIKDEFLKLQLLTQVINSLNIRYELNFSFVRGLAYYTGPIFEVIKSDLPFSIAGGGRYDTLIEIYGGQRTPAVGFAIGIERTIHALSKDYHLPKPNVKVVVVMLDNSVVDFGIKVSSLLRQEGLVSVLGVKDLSLSKLVPYYAEQGFTHMVIIGKREKEEGKVTIRNLSTRDQKSLKIDELTKNIII